jgi:predicted polyphosphate/ATP-dependent NAD kinase
MAAKTKIGLIVNPVAGMGGSLGLKGTDGRMRQRAVELGATTPSSPLRARQFLARIPQEDRVQLLVAPGWMGERCATGKAEVVGAIEEPTTAEDTRRIARQMVERGVKLLCFVGGDGTARDILDAVGTRVPVVAVPAGVKVFSAVFAVNPAAAAELVRCFLEGDGLGEQEVLDIDEEAFRQDKLASSLYGYLLTPRSAKLLQRGKECSADGAAAAQYKQALAARVVRGMSAGVLYLLGPGTTVKAVAEELGVDKTLLGVDALADGRLLGSDLGESGILRLMDGYAQTRVIVTPIGGNGFGRGNRQFSPQVLRRVDRGGIIAVATSDKLLRLEALRVDTGDPELDRALSGYIEVLVGGNESVKMEVRC